MWMDVVWEKTNVDQSSRRKEDVEIHEQHVLKEHGRDEYEERKAYLVLWLSNLLKNNKKKVANKWCIEQSRE